MVVILPCHWRFFVLQSLDKWLDCLINFFATLIFTWQAMTVSKKQIWHGESFCGLLTIYLPSLNQIYGLDIWTADYLQAICSPLRFFLTCDVRCLNQGVVSFIARIRPVFFQNAKLLGRSDACWHWPSGLTMVFYLNVSWRLLAFNIWNCKTDVIWIDVVWIKFHRRSFEFNFAHFLYRL